MSAIKKTISIDEDVAKEASKLNSNFSALVEAALIEYMQQRKIKKAIESFGKWKNREESGVEYVENLRRDDNREYIFRDDLKIYEDKARKK